MAKEKTAKELGEILAEQLDILSKGVATEEQRKTAGSIGNICGKLWGAAALEMKYARDQKRQPGDIPSLMR
jgi:hypothetical protein